MVNKTTDDTFKKEIEKGLVLVDFAAAWCGPCKVLSPFLDMMSQKYTSIKVLKVDIEESMQTSIDFKISSVPTIIVLQDGKEIDRVVGFGGKAALEALFEKHVK